MDKPGAIKKKKAPFVNGAVAKRKGYVADGLA
jgi:hypothetical protein